MKISARNQLKGTVIDIKEGAVNGVVTIDVDGNKLVADITMYSIKNLGLEIGKESYAVIKATSVMVAVD
ncbi:MAG: TOBE domain-containing protein [Lachnospiraceae bacterium]|nr:TOBE domain-containing protein [Lachnospiraceae bacterium]